MIVNNNVSNAHFSFSSLFKKNFNHRREWVGVNARRRTWIITKKTMINLSLPWMRVIHFLPLLSLFSLPHSNSLIPRASKQKYPPHISQHIQHHSLLYCLFFENRWYRPVEDLWCWPIHKSNQNNRRRYIETPRDCERVNWNKGEVDRCNPLLFKS